VFVRNRGEPARLSGSFYPAGCELTIATATRFGLDPFAIQSEGKGRVFVVALGLGSVT